MDEKYIRNRVQVVDASGEAWTVSEQEGVWYVWRGNEPARELGETREGAARTLEAAGWGLARAEAERMDREDAFRAPPGERVRTQIAYDAARGQKTPVEATDAWRNYAANVARLDEMEPEAREALDGAVDSVTAAKSFKDLMVMMAPDGVEQEYTPTLRPEGSYTHAQAVLVIQDACDELGFDYWPERKAEAEADAPCAGD